MDPDPSLAIGHVVATRTGVHDWQPGLRTVMVEFTGANLENPGESAITPVIEAVGDHAKRIAIQSVTLQKIPENRWRVSFQIKPAAEGVTLAEVGPVELRCSLKRGDDFLTETWAHRIIP
jgi:glucans biosynthesis protein